MTVKYPIILTPGKTHMLAHVPDLGISTQGDDMFDALRMAYDAIAVMLVDIEDDGDDFPASTPIETVRANNPGNTVIDLTVDTDRYRQRLAVLEEHGGGGTIIITGTGIRKE